MLVTELKSEALKERHWKQLMRNLRVAWQLHDLTLGQVWAVDLQRNEGIVKDVILVAQGEMALEEFLKMVGLAHYERERKREREREGGRDMVKNWSKLS